MVAATQIAAITWSTLIDTHPLWLLGLSSLNRYLAVTTNQLSAWSYYLVAGVRLLIPDPFFYLLGFWYGDRALRWTERRMPSTGKSYATFERLFSKAGYPLVFVAPNNLVSLLAGAAVMSPVMFTVLNVSGTIARLALIRAVGNVFDRPINAFTGFVADYRIPLLVLSVLAVGVTFWADWRKGGSGELGALRDLKSDLEAVEPASAADSELPEAQ